MSESVLYMEMLSRRVFFLEKDISLCHCTFDVLTNMFVELPQKTKMFFFSL